MAEPRCILHIGAPKCGSSALQAALTAAPDHKDSAGQRYRYVGTGTVEGRIYPLYGGVVRRLGRSSEFGYSCWPNLRAPALPQSGAADPVWDALARVMQNASRQGHVPMLSNEAGWRPRRPLARAFWQSRGDARMWWLSCACRWIG